MIALSRTTGSVRMCGGDFLLWIIRCYLLAQEEGPHARSDLLQ